MYSSKNTLQSMFHQHIFVLVTCLLLYGLTADGATSDGKESKTANACENDQLVLECQQGEVIRILLANYGRFTYSVCNRHGQTEGWNLQCMSSKAKDIISERCDGRRECNMNVSNYVFGEPCPSTSKYAEVKYTCHLALHDTSGTQISTTPQQIQPMVPINGSPRPPLITFANAVSPHQIEIMWAQAEPPTPILTTAVYYKDIAMDTGPSALYINTGKSLIIDSLKPNTTYSIFLKSFNTYGSSVPSNIISVITPPLVFSGEIRASTLTTVITRTTTSKPGLTTCTTKKFSSKTPSPTDIMDVPVAALKTDFISTMRQIFTSMFSSKNVTNLNGKATIATEISSISTILVKDENGIKLTTSKLGTVKPSPNESLAHKISSFTRQLDVSAPDIKSTMSTITINESTKNTLEVVPPTGLTSSNDQSPYEPQVLDVVNESINGVVDKFCEEKVHRGVLWPKTRFGRFAEKNCPEDMKGTAIWHCQSYGWEYSGPDLSDCISPWLERIDMQIERMVTRKEPCDMAAVVLNEALRDQDLTSGDLKRASMKLLPKLVKGFQQDVPYLSRPNEIQRMKTFQKAFVSASSNLLSKKNAESWKGLSRQDQSQSATSIVLAIEDTGFHIASLIATGTSEVTLDANLILEVNVIDTMKAVNDITFPSKNKDMSDASWKSITDSITISSNSLRSAGTGGTISLVFTLYKNIEDLMQPQPNTIPSVPSPSFPSDIDDYYSAEIVKDDNSMETLGASAVRVINTKIVAVSMNSAKQRLWLTEPVRFTLHHLKPSSESQPICAFWDMDPSHMTSQWSQDGCRLHSTNTTHTICECDHLTNFAVLMDVTGVKLSRENLLALRVVTYVGCVISVICLMLSWITFLVFKNLQCDRNTIHKNLVLCLLLAEIVFLTGIAQTEPKILCSIIACILHYLFLSAFAWMCLEGIQLYVMLVEVFEQEKSRVHWYYIFGYGAPAVIIAVSAGVYHQGYGTTRHCWLTTERYFIWSFVGPALAVMLINIIMLSIAIYIMCHHTNMSATMRERSKTTKFRAWLKGAIVLVVLLGLTWLLGVLYLNEESVVIAYFFTVLNSLQGLFIFVFHCLKNEKVQKEYRKVARRTPWLPNCIRVNYGGYTGVASSSPIGSSGSGNFLSKLFGQRNRNSGASTNSSAKPFLNNNNRRSDAENSTSKDSSNGPSSLNGYVYNPSCSTIRNGSHAQTPFLSTSASGIIDNRRCGQAQAAYNYERVDEMALDLSEYVDCSVVDSEYVSEYCKHNMQISREEQRYSTGSEDSDGSKPVTPHSNEEVDNLSTLSVASSSKKSSSFTSSTEVLNQSFSEDLNKNLREKLKKKLLDPHINLHQYIIPVYRISSSHNNNTDVKSINRISIADNINTNMNKLSKPATSLSSISESENSPQHPSAPNLFKLDFTKKIILKSSVENFPENNDVTQYISEPAYEERRIDLGSPSSTKSSLPNLSVNGLTIDCGDNTDFIFTLQRRSSETDIHFSPFKFSASNC